MEADGVEVKLRKLRRVRSINVQLVRDGLANRLTFIGKSFEVFVNGAKLNPPDRRAECEKAWEVTAIPPRMGTRH
jgi:hypothetical protein